MQHVLILPSDDSSHADNKIGQFSVSLETPIDLGDHEWEVALLDLTHPTRLRKPKKVMDPNKDFHLWTVKSSIVHTTSDNSNNVLRRFCPTVRQSGATKIVHRDFMNLHYKPLRTGLKVLDKIDITLCDQLDRPLKFVGGKSIATLCIRRK